MCVCYTYILFDDFDWGYQMKSKEEVIEELKKEFYFCDVLAQWRHYIVVDLDKNSPYRDVTQRLKKYCDRCWYYGDDSEGDLREFKFKETPEEKKAKEQEPANRNAKEIAEAFKEWEEKNVPNIRKALIEV